MKKLFLLLLGCLALATAEAQLSLTKMLGKDAKNYRIGYDLFSFFHYPLAENRSLCLELMDFAYFRGKDGDGFIHGSARAYLSIKVGYKYIFSETGTGPYLEPSAGYARVVEAIEGEDATYGDGFAAAMEGGYRLEVGENGHAFNFGLKLETDRAGRAHTITSLGFRLSYEFNMFHQRQ